jgi:hypothetical protein
MTWNPLPPVENRDRVRIMREIRIVDPDLRPLPAVGRRLMPAVWFQDNVAASQTAVVLNLEGGNRTEVVMVRAGAVTGIAVASNEARTAGTLTVDVTINGTVTGLTAVLDATNTTTDTGTQDETLDTYVAADLIGVKITTDGSWAPTTADITVCIELTEDD